MSHKTTLQNIDKKEWLVDIDMSKVRSWVNEVFLFYHRRYTKNLSHTTGKKWGWMGLWGK